MEAPMHQMQNVAQYSPKLLSKSLIGWTI
jgi:hypothetical protein